MQFRTLDHAIVLGGSMAGMLAARVLSPWFERVTILERDTYPLQPEPRTGVPQSRHLHALLTRGYRILEELFPGITRDWQNAGAEVLDLGRDFAWRTPCGWGIRFDSGLESLAASRSLIDHVVQRRVSALPNVSFRTGATVLCLVASEDRQRVVGVRVRTSDGAQQVVPASLVVDASGRMSGAPFWLEQLGYEKPQESVVDARLGYASRMYERRPEHERHWRAVFIQAAPPDQPRAGIAFPIEGKRWMVTQCGGGGDHAPTSEAEFIAFARSLPSGEIYNLITTAKPISGITGYRRTENRWRRYDKLQRLPDGFVLIGDSVCAFNPVYGQGMTTAALEAEALGRWVARRGATALSFQNELAKIITVPWTLATGEDTRYPGVGSRPALHEKLLQNYVHHVMRTSTCDVAARRALLDVFSMIAEPSRLMRPDVVFRVARALISGVRDGRPESSMASAPFLPAIPDEAART